jgi:archaellum component FlaC
MDIGRGVGNQSFNKVSNSTGRSREFEGSFEKEEESSNANDRLNDFRKIIRFEPDDEGGKVEDSKEIGGDRANLSLGKEDDSSKWNDIPSSKELVFQIRETQLAVKNLEKKLFSMSENIDDLIGLYEIVSGQMNPFVGLSKVTKKRLDVLENFDEEINSLKSRLDNLEVLIGNVDSKKGNDYVVSAEHIDRVTEEALEQVMESKRIDETIDRFIEGLKTNDMSRWG